MPRHLHKGWVGGRHCQCCLGGEAVASVGVRASREYTTTCTRQWWPPPVLHRHCPGGGGWVISLSTPQNPEPHRPTEHRTQNPEHRTRIEKTIGHHLWRVRGWVGMCANVGKVVLSSMRARPRNPPPSPSRRGWERGADRGRVCGLHLPLPLPADEGRRVRRAPAAGVCS